MLLLGGLNIPFPKVIKDTVRRYAAVPVSKMIKVRNDKLKSSTHLHGGTVTISHYFLLTDYI